MASFFEESLFFGMAVSQPDRLRPGPASERKKAEMGIFKSPASSRSVVVIVFLQVLHVDYETYNSTARVLGALLLTPATVCLAIPLYQRAEALKRESAGCGSGDRLRRTHCQHGRHLQCWLCAFGLNHEQYVTLLPKSITTAIGMGVSEELHGITTITVAAVVADRCTGKCDRGAGLQDLPDPGAHRQRPGRLEPPPMPSALPKPWNSARWKEP